MTGKTARVVTRSLGLAASIVLVLSGASAWALDEGERAPQLSGKDLQGKHIDLAALRGKVVLVDFMASWCKPCKKELPALEKLSRRYADKGLRIIAVSVDSKRENLEKFLKEVPVSFPVIHDVDHQIADRYEPSRMPSSYIVDPAGVVRYVHGGFNAGDEQKLERHIQALLK